MYNYSWLCASFSRNKCHSNVYGRFYYDKRDLLFTMVLPKKTKDNLSHEEVQYYKSLQSYSMGRFINHLQKGQVQVLTRILNFVLFSNWKSRIPYIQLHSTSRTKKPKCAKHGGWQAELRKNKFAKYSTFWAL